LYRCSKTNYLAVGSTCTLYRMNGNLDDPTEGESKPKFKYNYYINIGLLKRRFRITSSWMLERVFKVSTLNFHAGTVYWDHTSSYYDSWGCLSWFRRKCSPRTLATCGPGDCGSVMVYIWLCCTTFSLEARIILSNMVPEQFIWQWTNSMFCSNPWFISLRFLYLGKSEVYCLCYSSQGLPRLQTTNTELFDIISAISGIF